MAYFNNDMINFDSPSDNCKNNIEQLQTWAYINTCIVKFENVATERTFIKIFGEDKGKHLWYQFVNKCDRRYRELHKCFANGDDSNTADMNLFLNHVVYNDELYY